jgi:hypothetical protein
LDGFAGAALPHWSATLVALATLNCFIVLLLALAVPVFELEFIPAFAPADADPVWEVLEPVWLGLVVAVALAEPPLSDEVPVTCTWLPTSVRKLSRFPVSL